MKHTIISGSAIALAAAAFLANASLAPQAEASHHVKCFGLNACKGHGACKSAGNECKGKNACKGQGFSKMSKSKCVAKGGSTTRG